MRGGRWRGISRQQSAARYRDGGHGEREGQDHHQARPHAVLPPGKMTRLTTAALSKPKSNKITNCIDLAVTVRKMASATHSTAPLPIWRTVTVSSMQFVIL